MSDITTIEERYSSAVTASSLKVEADKGGAADVLIAAGWSPSRIGSALMRLHTKAKRAASSAKTNQRNLGKITMDIAREIRASNKLGKDWAAEIGCSATLISHVRCNRTWKETNNPFAGLMS